ncbi:MAG TPA: hypothetical protein VFH22_08790, partial [Rhodocyclaceae bacterium]|nr:hypothetical protein [Rhodocyclaceae bacterium]
SLLAVAGAARLLALDWRRLALGLVPLAGASLFLGLSMMTASHLRAEGFGLDALPAIRAGLLAGAVAWSGWLGWRLMRHALRAPHRPMPATFPANRIGTATQALALLLWLLPLALIAGHWGLVFFVW